MDRVSLISAVVIYVVTDKSIKTKQSIITKDTNIVSYVVFVYK